MRRIAVCRSTYKDSGRAEFSRHLILIILKFIDTFEFGKSGNYRPNGRFARRSTCLLSCEHLECNSLKTFPMNVIWDKEIYILCSVHFLRLPCGLTDQ